MDLDYLCDGFNHEHTASVKTGNVNKCLRNNENRSCFQTFGMNGDSIRNICIGSHHQFNIEIEEMLLFLPLYFESLSVCILSYQH